MSEPLRLTFLGGAGTVTGSKYLLEIDSRRVLIDCGLFQGLKRLRERNWQPLPFDPQTLDAIVLTHAHLDHSGYLPVLARTGFKGSVYCTAATAKLLKILLRDSRCGGEPAMATTERVVAEHRHCAGGQGLLLTRRAPARGGIGTDRVCVGTRGVLGRRRPTR